jgi:hypothetical protein
MPERIQSIRSCEIFLEISQRKISQTELTAFEKAQLKDRRQGKQHKKAKKQSDKNGDGGNNEFINFHPSG